MKFVCTFRKQGMRAARYIWFGENLQDAKDRAQTFSELNGYEEWTIQIARR